MGDNMFKRVKVSRQIHADSQVRGYLSRIHRKIQESYSPSREQSVCLTQRTISFHVPKECSYLLQHTVLFMHAIILFFHALKPKQIPNAYCKVSVRHFKGTIGQYEFLRLESISEWLLYNRANKVNGKLPIPWGARACCWLGFAVGLVNVKRFFRNMKLVDMMNDLRQFIL